MLYGKSMFKNANLRDIIMMPKMNAPTHSYENPQIYYQKAENQMSPGHPTAIRTVIRNDQNLIIQT